MKKMSPVVHFEMQPDMSDQAPSVVIEVDDITEYIKTITEAGGNILGEPTEIPEIGKYVSFIETEVNRVSILQPAAMD